MLPSEKRRVRVHKFVKPVRRFAMKKILSCFLLKVVNRLDREAAIESFVYNASAGISSAVACFRFLLNIVNRVGRDAGSASSVASYKFFKREKENYQMNE